MKFNQPIDNNHPVIISTCPWTRINEDYLNGSIDYSVPTKDYSHKIIKNAKCIGESPNYYSFYKHIALELVSETVFNYPYPQITEKTSRTILNYRMFIIAGAPGTLKMLQNRGFETWSDLIDESYDDITEPNSRLKAIMKSLNDFLSLDLHTVKNYMNKNKDRFCHNAENLRVLNKKRELEKLILTLENI